MSTSDFMKIMDEMYNHIINIATDMFSTKQAKRVNLDGYGIRTCQLRYDDQQRIMEIDCFYRPYDLTFDISIDSGGEAVMNPIFDISERCDSFMGSFCHTTRKTIITFQYDGTMSRFEPEYACVDIFATENCISRPRIVPVRYDNTRRLLEIYLFLIDPGFPDIDPCLEFINDGRDNWYDDFIDLINFLEKHNKLYLLKKCRQEIRNKLINICQELGYHEGVELIETNAPIDPFDDHRFDL